MRELVARIFNEAPAPEHVRSPRGSVDAFILANINHGHQGTYQGEANRIWQLAQEAGIDSTPVYILHRVRKHMKEHRQEMTLLPAALTAAAAPAPAPAPAARPLGAEGQEPAPAAARTTERFQFLLQGGKMLQDWEELLQVMLAEVRVVRAEYEMLKSRWEKAP